MLFKLSTYIIISLLSFKYQNFTVTYEGEYVRAAIMFFYIKAFDLIYHEAKSSKI